MLTYVERAIAAIQSRDIGAREVQMTTNRAAKPTRQLFSLARTRRVDAAACDANEVISNFQPILDRMVGRDVHVSYALDASAARVAVYRAGLDQVLINLTVDALVAMPDGGELTMTTTNEWRPRQVDRTASQALVEYVVIRITGTGAFERFFTARTSRRGTGIGLQAVRGIVTLAGGRIDVISTPGGGTTFRVLLPVQPSFDQPGE